MNPVSQEDAEGGMCNADSANRTVFSALHTPHSILRIPHSAQTRRLDRRDGFPGSLIEKQVEHSGEIPV